MYVAHASTKYVATRNVQNMNVWTKLRRLLEEAVTILANAHAVAHDELLRAVVDGQSDRKQHQAYHEQRAIVDAAANALPHFLRDNSCHGVHRLEKCAKSLCEIRNGDAVSGAEQHHHRFSYDAAECEQHCRNDPRQQSPAEHAQYRLKPIGAQSVGSFFETARHVTKRVFGESKNRGHSHQGEQTTRGEHIQALADWKERHPFHERGT